MIEYRNLRVAILGAGSVGAQVAALLLEHGDELANRVGAGLELVGIAVRDLDAPRSTDIPRELLTTDANSLILGADIVIELIGGLEPAREYVSLALNSGADVITGNKALLATHGPELFAIAEQVGAQLYYEAAVGGAIPIIRPLRDSLAGDRVHRILGIVNGTTNYILDRMDREGDSFEQALAAATELGYAEADPTADIEGYDAAQKATILASLAFHTTVPLEAVHREGISRITHEQVVAAREAGFVVKLLAVCERLTDAETGIEGVSARVHPALVPQSHPLAAVHGANNAVFLEAEAAGQPHVLRRGRRGSADRIGGARRPRVGRAPPRDRRPGRRRVDPREPADPSDLRGRHPVPDHPRGRRQARRARRASPPCSPSTASRSRPCSRTCAAGRSTARRRSRRRQRPPLPW